MATPYKRGGSGPTVALLSWLDFCLQNQLDFDESIIQHLRESSKESDGGEFIVTRNQVVGKLRTICTADRPSDEEVLKPEKLRTKGSQCLETVYRQLWVGIAWHMPNRYLDGHQVSVVSCGPQSSNRTSLHCFSI